MERIAIVYEGKPLSIEVTETDHLVYEQYLCKIDRGREMRIQQAETGLWMEIAGTKMLPNLLADLIGRELTRTWQTTVTDDAFLITTTHHGKVYNLTVVPEPGELSTSYRVLQGNQFLMKVWPPDGAAWKNWHTSLDSKEQDLAAAIGQAIENYED